jgi:N-acetyl-anhydromuramyl-L-alanine amidase AmpD
MKTLPIQSEGRKALAREYARIHYGLDEWRLVAPRLVIVHYTGSDSDAVSLSVFKPARLEASRTDIEAGGSLNVGVHYMIAKDGTIWSLLPESDMGRHAIGYNHVALGIELTGSSADKLTPAQLEACAALVADIARRTPSITYLCGHHEYVQEGRAHTVLYRELQPGYGPTRKTDPGEAFMNALRRLLLDRYSLNFLD